MQQTENVALSQKHVSGRSAWQNTSVGFGGRITLNRILCGFEREGCQS